jgi:DNA-binding beta-propeller fold protein YncE
MKFKNSEVFKLLNSAKDKEEVTLTHLNRNEDQSPIMPILIAGGEACGNHAGQANEALFSSPFGIAQHPNGSIYIADTENASIKLISTNCSVVVTVATDRHGLKTPTGLAVCPNTGNVYIADVGTQCVHVMTPDGHLDVLSGDGTAGYQEADGPTPAKWDLPWALALDLNGDLIVCDRNNHCVRKIELSKFVGERPGQGGGFKAGGEGGEGEGMGEALPAQEASIAHGPQPPTKLVAGAIGNPGTEDGPATDAKFDSPSAIAVGPDGTIYCSDIGSNHLRKITPDQKTVLTLPGIYHGALGLDVDSYGRVYVANTDAKQIIRNDPDGRLTVLKTQSLQKPVGVRVDSSSGVVFVADLHAFKSLRVVKCLPPTPSTLETDLADLLCQEDQDNFSDITFQVEGKKFRGSSDCRRMSPLSTCI